MKQTINFNTKEITHIIFDVDGTLYNKNKEYTLGSGTLEDTHEFLRYTTFQQALNGYSAEEIKNKVFDLYLNAVSKNTILGRINKFPVELKNEYKELTKEFGSNGKVFNKKFGLSSSFFAEIIGFVDYEYILKEDTVLQNTIQYLKSKHKLGIFTTETYQTTEKVTKALGLSLEDFFMETGTDYPILCSENVPEKKPSKMGFKKLIEYTNNPSKIVYIGDSLEKDILPALELGLNGILVLYGKNRKRDDRFLEIDELYELKKYF